MAVVRTDWEIRIKERLFKRETSCLKYRIQAVWTTVDHHLLGASPPQMVPLYKAALTLRRVHKSSQTEPDGQRRKSLGED